MKRYALLGILLVLGPSLVARAESRNSEVDRAVGRGLEWLASRQSRLGHWTAGQGNYPTAMTALSGMAMLCEGSTTCQGKYARNLRRAVTYLCHRSRPNGLIGDPNKDDRYTYGHGFATMFLSQVLGEEEDEERRKELVRVLTKAVEFSGRAQTKAGGWGYVSAADGNQFDEGSTTITQVQALRGCRNAGIPVPPEIFTRAIEYIEKCTNKKDGGVAYNINSGGGGRPAITAAAVACLYNAGEYDNEVVPLQLEYCKKRLNNLGSSGFGHWHYAHYYYSQVMYRAGGEGPEGLKTWETYRKNMETRLLKEVSPDGSWGQSYIGSVYTTSIVLAILQLDKGLVPLYQR